MRFTILSLILLMMPSLAQSHDSPKDHRFCRRNSPYYDHHRCHHHRHVDGDDVAVASGSLLGLTATTASLATTEESQNDRREMIVRGAMEEYLAGERSSSTAHLMALIAKQRKIKTIDAETEASILEEIALAMEKRSAEEKKKKKQQ